MGAEAVCRAEAPPRAPGDARRGDSARGGASRPGSAIGSPEALEALQEACAVAGVPVDEALAVAQAHQRRLEIERHGLPLARALAELVTLRAAAAALRRASRLSPAVVAVGGIADWQRVGGVAVVLARELAELADAAAERIEARAAAWRRGGHTNILRLIWPERPLVRLALDLAALMPPVAVTSTKGGRFFDLVAAVHGDEAGVDHAVREAVRAYRSNPDL